MPQYTIKDYRRGYELDQVRIGQEVARNWIWPYAYDLDDLVDIHSQPNFDPDTRHYCFLGDEMVGYGFSVISTSGTTASLEFPRVLPGHESTAELLIGKALKTLAEKGISRVTGRVTTMCPGDIRLADKMGFSIHDWGHKVYYSYDMGWGRLGTSSNTADEINPDKDLDECARLSTNWYKRSVEWCHSLLVEWHKEGVITHLGVRDQGKMIASCMAAPNLVRSSTAAIYYIYTPDEQCLKTMVLKAVDKCIDYGVQNLIADLVNEHQKYESVYQKLGFKQVAVWARCEKALG